MQNPHGKSLVKVLLSDKYSHPPGDPRLVGEGVPQGGGGGGGGDQLLLRHHPGRGAG